MRQRRAIRAVAGATFVVLLAASLPGWAQESVAVRAMMTKEPIPLDDPNAAAWTSAPQAQFPLSPQVHWQNRIQEVTVKDVKVRALNDGQRVAVLLEYTDPTEDPADAAALEFMVGDKKAHFAHGQPMAQVQGGPVNIWFWRNKDGKGVDMSAMGFGTLKAQTHQDVTAKHLEGRLLSRDGHRTSRRGYAAQARRIHQYRVRRLGWTQRRGRRPRRKGIAEGGLLLVVFPR